MLIATFTHPQGLNIFCPLNILESYADICIIMSVSSKKCKTIWIASFSLTKYKLSRFNKHFFTGRKHQNFIEFYIAWFECWESDFNTINGYIDSNAFTNIS
ncbi:MAG: hypothetical protein QOJ02_3286 [Acidobacteriota bacterium]|nr:hypothetical protein [Acidobacteriota bacterium]